MLPLEVLDISKEAMMTLIKVSAPLMLISMSIGLLVSLLQALTQIQEVTLVFVPKILGLFLAIILFSGFISSTLSTFMDHIVEFMMNI